MELKILGICSKIDVSQLLREVKRSLCMVLYKESPYDLINVLGPLSVILQAQKFYKIEFTDIFSAGKKARKMTKIL